MSGSPPFAGSLPLPPLRCALGTPALVACGRASSGGSGSPLCSSHSQAASIGGEQLTVGRGRRALLNGLNFGLPAGECWAIVGRNGSGKSTLLTTLAGLIPALGGEVSVLGRALRAWRRPELARRLGFLPQAQPMMFPYTVAEFVGLGRVPWNRDRHGPASAGILDQVLGALGLEPLRSCPVTALSGGEAQLVCIAQLLAQTTDILLLDEPLSHLDLPHQFGVMRQLRGLADQGHAVALATHDLALAWRFCDRLLILDRGEAHLVGRQDPEEAAKTLSSAFAVDFVVDDNGPRFAAAVPRVARHLSIEEPCP